MMVCGRFSGCGYMSETVVYVIAGLLVLVMLAGMCGAVIKAKKSEISKGRAVEWFLVAGFNIGLIYLCMR